MAAGSWVLIGEGTLLAGCGDILLRQGQPIAAVVSGEASIVQWAAERDIRVEPATTDLASVLSRLEFQHLASIAHLSIIPAEALRLVPGLAVNFHDGPLPELAGLNVTTWAILRGEKTHGITWHAMTERLDAGRVLEERRFEIAADETAFLLNAKCYAAGLGCVRRSRAADRRRRPARTRAGSDRPHVCRPLGAAGGIGRHRLAGARRGDLGAGPFARLRRAAKSALRAEAVSR